METSKKLLWLTAVLAVLMTVIGAALACKGLAIDLMIVVVPLAWSPFDIAIGFYLWKSKNENRAKYAQKFLNKFAEQHGTDAALRAAEIVLKD